MAGTSILDFLNSVSDYKKAVSKAEQVREILPASAWLSQEYYVGPSGMRLYPFWKEQIIDIFEKNRGKYNEVIVTGGLGIGKCVPAGVRVQTEKGYKRIEDLCKSRAVGFIPMTLKVSTRSGEKETDAFYYEKNCKVWNLHLSDGSVVKGTQNHRILALTANGPELVPCKDLKPGSVLLRASDSVSLETSADSSLTEMEAYILGLWLGDGSCYQNGNVLAYSIECEKAVINAIKGDRFGEPRFTQSNTWKVNFRVPFARKFESWVGGKSDASTKRVPEIVFESSPVKRLQTLWGYIDSDGTVGCALEIVTKSPELAATVIELCHSLGMYPVVKDKILRTGPYAGRVYKRIRFHSEDLPTLLSVEIPWSRKWKAVKEKVDNSSSINKTDFVVLTDEWVESHKKDFDKASRGIRTLRKIYSVICNSGYRNISKTRLAKTYLKYEPLTELTKYRFMEVESISYTEEDVFDVSVPDGHEFQAQGLANHNTTFGLFLLIRRLYELSCYKRVQCLFDLMPSAILAMIYFSLSQKLAKKSGFGQLLNLIDEIPYFREVFARDFKNNTDLKFPENILIYSGSSASAATGMNLIGSLLDEANFFGTAGLGGTEGHEVDYTKVSAMYTAIVNRGQSRFKKNGRDDSLSVLVSSTTTQSSLTESRIAKAIAEGDKSHTKVVVGNLWNVKPKGTYSSKMFWVFLGSEILEPKIVQSVGDVETGVQHPVTQTDIESAIAALKPSEKEKFKQVPEDFRSAFEKDIVYSIRDILGVSIASLGRLFNSNELYERSVAPMDNKERPFVSDELTLATMDDSNVASYVNSNFVPENISIPRYFHYDQSTTTDRTGTAWAYVHHTIIEKTKVLDQSTGTMVEREVTKPVFCVEGAVSCIPPKAPKKISIRKCRDIIFHLRDNLGLIIGGGTYDQFASAEARQEFQERGVDAQYLSVDRTDEQYLLFVTLLNEGRIIWHRNAIAKKELFDLEHNRARRKVDHPKNSSKDLMDAVVGAVWNAHEAYSAIDKSGDAQSVLSVIDYTEEEDLFPEFSNVLHDGKTSGSFLMGF